MTWIMLSVSVGSTYHKLCFMQPINRKEGNRREINFACSCQTLFIHAVIVGLLATMCTGWIDRIHKALADPSGEARTLYLKRKKAKSPMSSSCRSGKMASPEKCLLYSPIFVWLLGSSWLRAAIKTSRLEHGTRPKRKLLAPAWYFSNNREL